jgi:hypothetical protein
MCGHAALGTVTPAMLSEAAALGVSAPVSVVVQLREVGLCPRLSQPAADCRRI